uniref:Uncharacterized protein n=1 Tax=Romanomermis culicivorax TaxID=13658 RepID=A0A915K8B6_ROMCU
MKINLLIRLIYERRTILLIKNFCENHYQSGANSDTRKAHLRNWRIDNPFIAVFLPQSFTAFISSVVLGHFFTNQKDSVVVLYLFVLGGNDRLAHHHHHFRCVAPGRYKKQQSNKNRSNDESRFLRTLYVEDLFGSKRYFIDSAMCAKRYNSKTPFPQMWKKKSAVKYEKIFFAKDTNLTKKETVLTLQGFCAQARLQSCNLRDGPATQCYEENAQKQQSRTYKNKMDNETNRNKFEKH